MHGHPMPYPGGLPLLRVLSENWWLILLRGIAAIAFGVLAFVWPGITLFALVLLWAAYAVLDGIFALWAAIAGKGADWALRWWFALVGVAGIVAGVLAFAWPDVTALVLLMVIAGWAIVIGALQIWGAIELRKEIENEWWLLLSGVLSIAFGGILFAQPAAGALAVVWIIGWYAILLGCLYLVLAFRLRSYKSRS
jgi:uncharacterized membrane protein HdeD (DUF308 family)